MLFSLVQEKVHLLEEKLQLAYEKVIGQSVALSYLDKATLCPDAKISLDEVTLENYKLIEKLAPFGVGNSKPLFLFEKIVLESVRMFGKENNHLELMFKNSRGKNIKAIGFFMKIDSWGKELKAGDKINLLANFEKSTFRGFTELRLRIVDLQIMI